jgi:hypothetical protein
MLCPGVQLLEDEQAEASATATRSSVFMARIRAAVGPLVK